MSASIEVPSAVDERFRRRSVYWVPGDSVLVEPWYAVAESNVGHLAVPCGRNREHAHTTAARWRALLDAAVVDPHRIIVGAAVVDPRGDVVASWGSVPVPGGAPRWVGLYRLDRAETCLGCGAPRWAGCWVPRDLSGCGECQPEREAADPRVWPLEPDPPAGTPVPRKKTAARKTTRKTAPQVVSPDQGRLE